MQSPRESPKRGTGSIILDALSAETRDEVLKESKHSLLSMGTALFRTDDPATHVYILSGGVASLTRPLPDGSDCEIAIYGNAAAPGAPALLGSEVHYTCCFMQSPGSAYQLRMNIARSLFADRRDFRETILAFLRDRIRMQEVMAACTARHLLEQRLARWLASYLELTDSNVVMLTQEHLARVLSAQRVSVSIAISGLQRAGVIKQSRGHLIVKDREGLQNRACSCYALWKQIYLQRRNLTDDEPGLG